MPRLPVLLAGFPWRLHFWRWLHLGSLDLWRLLRAKTTSQRPTSRAAGCAKEDLEGKGDHRGDAPKGEKSNP